MPELHAAVHDDQERGSGEVPQELVQERRVEQGAGREVTDARGDRGVDLEPPRQRRRRPEELLVEPVAQPTDRLRDEEPGRDGVRERREADALTARADPRADRTECDRAPDAEPALPDVQRRHRVSPGAEVRVRGGDDVIEPPTDDAERHRPVDDRQDLVGVAATLDPAPVGEGDGDEDADDDRQGVRAQREGPEVPHRL